MSIEIKSLKGEVANQKMEYDKYVKRSGEISSYLFKKLKSLEEQQPISPLKESHSHNEIENLKKMNIKMQSKLKQQDDQLLLLKTTLINRIKLKIYDF